MSHNDEECPLCMELYRNDRTHCDACKQSFCYSCALKLGARLNATCPYCRKSMTIENLTVHYRQEQERYLDRRRQETEQRRQEFEQRRQEFEHYRMAFQRQVDEFHAAFQSQLDEFHAAVVHAFNVTINETSTIIDGTEETLPDP